MLIGKTAAPGAASLAFVLALAAGPALANGGSDTGHHDDGGHHNEGGHHDDGGDNAESGSFAFGAPGDPDEVDRTITVVAENLAFDRSEIAVRPGETIRFVVRNEGAMRHDFTIGPADVQKQHRQEMRDAMGNDQSAHSHGNAVMLAPGETAELIWRFDEVEPVMFGCNVPGHFDRMNGQFTPAG